MTASQCHCHKSYLMRIASFHVTFLLLFMLVVLTPHAASLEFNYENFSNTGDTLNLIGEVYQHNGFLNLTEYKKDSLGRVIYYKLLHLWDKNSGKVTNFTTRFTFSIDTLNMSQRGDGITFYLAQPDFPLPVPSDGSGIGLMSRDQMANPNYTEEHPFVAVEFDTFGNDWDPPYDHVGIDIKDIRNAYTTEWFCIRDGRGYDAVINYDSGSNNLSVAFSGYEDNITKITQQNSRKVNLRDVLPEWVEFGFTSATGLIYEYHTLRSWHFNSTLADFEAPIQEKDDGSKKGLVIGLSVGGACVLVGVLGLAFLFGWKMRKRGRESPHLAAMDEDFARSTGPKRFSYEELVRATNNFAKEHKIGEGGFGGVYKGFLRDLNIHVAIKRVSQESRQGVKEYASEVKIISQLRHKNLVNLMGWCHQQNELLLIYEFVENGSLDSYLFKGKVLLTWEVRYNIAKGLASALLYLHEEWDQCVLHRDIKPSNIMLDSNFNAKLGDFGLARVLDHGIGSKTTTLAGTLGYLSPEAATRGKTSKESDVYSFGVVALEIACGRRVIENNLNEDQIYLVEWVWKLYGMGGLIEAADPRLQGALDQSEMERLMIVGLWCTHMDYVLRPTIRQAFQVLSFEAPVPNLPSQLQVPSYYLSFSSLLPSTPASGYNQTQASTSSHSSSFTTGSSSSNTTSEVSNLQIEEMGVEKIKMWNKS